MFFSADDEPFRFNNVTMENDITETFPLKITLISF